MEICEAVASSPSSDSGAHSGVFLSRAVKVNIRILIKLTVSVSLKKMMIIMEKGLLYSPVTHTVTETMFELLKL